MQRQLFGPMTKTDKLIHVLSDGKWHSTKELVRRVGHTFAVAKFALIRDGHRIDREVHPTQPRQHRYKLIAGPTG